MVNPRIAYFVFLGLFAAERMVELVLSARNVHRALHRGAVEQGRGHYPVMVAFHCAALVACAIVAASQPVPSPWALLAVLGALAAQGLRWWTIVTLGDRWSTRILVLPDEPPVTSGPYRWLRHPNYLAVVLEMVLVPLAWGAWRTAIALSLGNALLLRLRISAEERALGGDWAKAFAAKPRLFPCHLRPTAKPIPPVESAERHQVIGDSP